MDENIEWVQELQKQMRYRRDPWVVLEGRHAVEAAIGGWWDVVGIVAAQESRWEPPNWSGLHVTHRPRKELEAIAGYPFHRGVMGLARQPEDAGDLAGLMPELEANATVVVCPRLGDAANAGAVIRNAAGLGASAVVFGNQGVSPFERKAVRSSAGALFRLPVRVADGGQILRTLKAAGFTLIGAAGDDDAAGDLGKSEMPAGRLALVIGSEPDGLGGFWSAACDELLRIPMQSGLDSLNAAAASAVLLWHLSRSNREP